MNDVIKWVLGIFFVLILGSFSYTSIALHDAKTAATDVEDRLTRQLDIIERKIDQVIVRQWEERERRR